MEGETTYSGTLGNDDARLGCPRRDLLHLPIDPRRGRRRRRHRLLADSAVAAAADFDASNKSDLRQSPWLPSSIVYGCDNVLQYVEVEAGGGNL